MEQRWWTIATAEMVRTSNDNIEVFTFCTGNVRLGQHRP